MPTLGRTEANLPRLVRHLSIPGNAMRLFARIRVTQLAFSAAAIGLFLSLGWYLGGPVVVDLGGPVVAGESWPWISIGVEPVGIVAIGAQPTGVVAVGGLPIGLISIGGLSLGVLSLGGASLGVVSLGGGSLGVVSQAPRGGSAGWLSAGGISAGWYSVGGHSFGAYALGEYWAAGIYHSKTFAPTGAGNQRAGV